MYKPPENSNRVKSIKSKFEHTENENPNVRKNGTHDLGGSKQGLSRQISDPAKRNIKRTPAFRIDTNSDKSHIQFQRNASYNRSYYFDKIQQYNSALKSCDTNRNVTTNQTDNKNSCNKTTTGTNVKPVLLKSKSSHDFAYIRSKFDVAKVQENQRINQNVANVNKAALYTEPVPKALRPKKTENATSDKKVENSTSEIITKDVDSAENCTNEFISNDFHSANTLVLSDSKQSKRLSDSLTDTLKAALKKPLPKGPAPQKPPRTFEHTPNEKSSKNISFLHRQSDSDKSASGKKHDPRYMLSKLENALRNNKLKIKKPIRSETTTSGEDSDDSVLFKSKTQREIPLVPPTAANSPPSFNLNCLHGLTGCRPTYETIKEPNSSFFVSCENDEPVYAEPYNYSQDSGVDATRLGNKVDSVLTNLHYLSTPLMKTSDNVNRSNMGETQSNLKDTVNRKLSENSSQSSFTSDIDSAASTPLDEKSFDAPVKIRQLIDAFESPKSKAAENQRLDDLKMCIQQTIETCFEGDDDDRLRKGSVDKIIDKFQTYIKTMPKYQTPKVNPDDRLFYCCLVVGWTSNRPQIKFRFPANVKVPDKIEDLCYPEVASGPLDISDNAQCYTLVITNDKGERTFGYCRRVIPEGCNRCIPLAYCILSKHRAPRFYKKILAELESRHGIADKLRDELINEFYSNKFPRPGESIKIDLTKFIDDLHSTRRPGLDLSSFVRANMTGYGSLNDTKKTNVTNTLAPAVDVEKGRLTLTMHQDTRYEEADLKPLHTLPSDILLKIFASLLLERKVVLISCVMSKLSCCVDALQSILYPFSWPHTFIPILPQCLWDVVESPTPVICGILSVSVVNDHKIEHGIVVDLDEGSILSEEGDEDSILSDSMKKAWHQGLALANRIQPEDYAHSVYLSDAYIKVFIISLKHYKTHINGNVFDKEAFIRGGKTRGIRRFLKWFTETSLFDSFIESVANNPDSFTLFDNKIKMYGSDESNIIMTKLLEWKK